MIFNKLSRLFIVISILSGLPGRLLAGPPLVIDDPGILDPGQWEFIGATSWTETDAGRVHDAPLIDISYGITENLQASAVWGYVWVDPDGGSSEYDSSSPAVQVKWRFYNGERLQMAFGPGYLFGISANRAALGIGTDDDVALLPVTFEYAVGGDWVLNAEVAYAAVEKDEDEWAYGASIGHPLANTMLFFELYGATDSEFDDNVLNFTVGADVEITPAWHLLFSVGSGISEPSGAEKLDATAFLGIQYFTGMD